MRTPVPLPFERLSPEEALRRSRAFLARMQARRSVRMFSPEPVPRELVENAMRVAGTAPSGAHQQPWTFVVVSDPELKAQLREAAEEEEREFYERRATPEWLEAVAPLGTDAVKTHITDAPYVIVVFEQAWRPGPDGAKVGSTTTCASRSGSRSGSCSRRSRRRASVALTHTPSPMGFLRELLGRPENERPFLLIPVGYPAEDAVVPALERKPLEEIGVFL